MGCNTNSGVKKYVIRAKRQAHGWWDKVDTIWANNADEAAEAFCDRVGINPPNEFAVQSTTGSSDGVFKIFRVKPRRSYDLEVV